MECNAELAMDETRRSAIGRSLENIGRRDDVSRAPEHNNYASTDSGRLSRYKPDAGSQRACKAARDHRSGNVRNAKPGPANSENSRHIDVAPGGPHTYALKRCEPRTAARRCAEDSKGPQSVAAPSLFSRAKVRIELELRPRETDRIDPADWSCARDSLEAFQALDFELPILGSADHRACARIILDTSFGNPASCEMCRIVHRRAPGSPHCD